jgi:phosphate/sulfate permease
MSPLASWIVVALMAGAIAALVEHLARRERRHKERTR